MMIYNKQDEATRAELRRFGVRFYDEDPVSVAGCDAQVASDIHERMRAADECGKTTSYYDLGSSKNTVNHGDYVLSRLQQEIARHEREAANLTALVLALPKVLNSGAAMALVELLNRRMP